jgi:iron complex transport system substrate-binding protein
MKGTDSGPGKSEEDMATLWQKLKDVRNFPGFLEINAIKNNNLYIIDRDITSGPRWVVGHAYFAKCMHPELFTDINPEEWNQEYLKEFFGLDINGTWAYPMPK